MGMTYSAGVFFGACVPRDSAAGRTLDAYVERHGGTFAPTEEPGVEIGEIGSQPTGELWMTVVAKGSARSFSKGDEVVAPMLLSEDAARVTSISRFLISVGIIGLPIGWHFEGSVY